MRNRGWAATGAAAGMGGLALLLAACGSSGSNTNAGAAYGGSGMGTSPSASAMSGAGTTSGMGSKTVTLTIKATHIGQVLTNAQGDTLYWYSRDTKDGPSTCTGSCAAEWPMVAGQAVPASGVKLAGELGTVTDAGGARQATYNGYPLYTYAGDKTPGQTTGNGEGGVWHVISGSALTAAAGMSSPSATKSVTSSGGYGYGSGAPITSSGSSAGHKASAAPAKATTTPVPAAPAPATTAPATTAPAPVPTSAEGAGCGEGACW
jgi:predicted lipoprotein with Yx(FWY)xxD motif